MAESRGGKEDMRLKKSFSRLWKGGFFVKGSWCATDRSPAAQLKRCAACIARNYKINLLSDGECGNSKVD